MEFLEKYAEKHQLKLYEALQETLEEPLIASSKAAEFVKLIESYKQAFQLYKLTDLLTGLMNDSGYEAMLRLSGEDDPLYGKTKAILNMFPGESGVVLYFADTKQRRGTRCVLMDSLLKELKNVLGEGNVVIK